MGGDDDVVEGGMKTIQLKDPGLFDHEHRMKKLAEGPDPLARLNARIEWEMFRLPLERAVENYAQRFEKQIAPYLFPLWIANKQSNDC